MDILKTFDATAMIAPKGPDHILALLEEFMLELEILQGHFEKAAEKCGTDLAAA